MELLMSRNHHQQTTYNYELKIFNFSMIRINSLVESRVEIMSTCIKQCFQGKELIVKANIEIKMDEKS